MSRKLKYDIPGRDFRIDREQFPVPATLADWERVFAPDVAPPLRLVVDIGFGRGELLLDLARQEPRRAFVGIERSFKRTLKMTRRLARLGLSNVRLVESTGQAAVAGVLPAASIETAWINFPDPWPKSRHARRRLVQPEFIRDLARCLAPGGVAYLATDDPDYASQIAEVLAGEPRLANAYAPDAYRREFSGRVATAYELEWLAQGRSFHYFVYQKAVASDESRGAAALDTARPSA